jgi:hypothetical protein
MLNVQLTKRNYLGVGYFHEFRNDITQETVYVQTTKEQYESMGGKGGSANNPTLAGHTWVCSFGGCPKVDSPNGLVGKNEYCEIGDQAYVVLDTRDFTEKFKYVPLDSVKNDTIAVSDTISVDSGVIGVVEEIM